MLRMSRRSLVALSAFLVGAAGAAQLPMGTEQQANNLTTADQIEPAVAAAPDGTFVVAWASRGWIGPDGANSSIQGRRFGNGGGALGSQFQVNQATVVGHHEPEVHVEADGEFVVVWSDHSTGPTYAMTGARARRYSSSGSPLTGAFNVLLTREFAEPVTSSVSPGGEFVVARARYEAIEGYRFGAGGVLEASFSIDNDPDHQLRAPSVVISPSGDFVVVWGDTTEESYPALARDIRLQTFDAQGAPVGAIVEVAGGQGSTGARSNPRIARNSVGNLLVVWQDEVSSGGDTSLDSLQARAFDPAGLPIGPQFQVNDRTLGDQRAAAVAAAPDGSFVVAWETSPAGVAGAGDGSGSGIRMRHLGADGVPRGSSVAVNSLTTGDQSEPAISVLPAGNFVVAWTSEVSDGGDDSQASIQFRRFRPALFADGFERGDVSRWTTGGD